METESKESIVRHRRRAIVLDAAEFALVGAFTVTVLIADRLTARADGFGVHFTAISLPTIMLTAWFAYYAWQITELPEFEQLIATRALAIACGLTVWIVTIWGLCVIFLSVPALGLAMIAPLSAVLYALARGILAAVYR